MPDDSGFLVEEFIQSITAQLDRVQDVLRLKALTRPLTYALKDFAVDLNVFVDMDAEGKVRFRTSGPNETGASIVHLGFTTITKPMIEENTVSLAMTKSPTLNELGLEQDERRRLEQLGVRNAAQLQQLRQSTSTTTIARYTGVPVNRLRQAMMMGQPFVQDVKPEGGPPTPTQGPRTPPGAKPPAQQPPAQQPPSSPPVRPSAPSFPDRGPVLGQPRPTLQPPLSRPPAVSQPPLQPPSHGTLAPTAMPPIRVGPDTQRLRLSGGNLLDAAGTPSVRLAGQALNVDVLDDDEMIIELPPQHQGGALEIALPHGETLSYELALDDPSAGAEAAGEVDAPDPWSPRGGEQW